MGLLRVHLLTLGRQLNSDGFSQHPVMTWLAQCVADVATKYLHSASGSTGYERLFGTQVNAEGLEFGERVLWRDHRTHDIECGSGFAYGHLECGLVVVEHNASSQLL